MRRRRKRLNKYQRYMRSKKWRTKREAVIKRDGGRCKLCNSDKDLQAHHRTYKDLGHEKMVDLVCLCVVCHDLFHQNLKLTKTPKKPPETP